MWEVFPQPAHQTTAEVAGARKVCSRTVTISIRRVTFMSHSPLQIGRCYFAPNWLCQKKGREQGEGNSPSLRSGHANSKNRPLSNRLGKIGAK
jgi:hypothetical protein